MSTPDSTPPPDKRPTQDKLFWVYWIAAWLYFLAGLGSAIVGYGGKPAVWFILFAIFLVLSIKRGRQAQQQADASAHSTTQPFPTKLKWILVFSGLLSGLSLIIMTNLIRNKKPQLDLTNTGTNSVTIVFGKDVHDVLPGNTYHARFHAGDTITFRPPTAAPGAGLTVTLDAPAMKAGSPPRVAAEVNADIPAQIRFHYK